MRGEEGRSRDVSSHSAAEPALFCPCELRGEGNAREGLGSFSLTAQLVCTVNSKGQALKTQYGLPSSIHVYFPSLWGPGEPGETESYTCTPGYTRTHYTAQADLEFVTILLPKPPGIDYR